MWQSEDLKDLVRHLEWADAKTWQAVLENAEDSLDSKIELWLYHFHTTQHAFVHFWRGEPLEFPELSQLPDPASLARFGRQAHGRIRDFLAIAGDADLEKEFEVPWSEQFAQRWNRPMEGVTVGQSVVQVAMHSTHHRGQVAARLREIGGEPPTMDYILWLWLGRPDPEWPESL